LGARKCKRKIIHLRAREKCAGGVVRGSWGRLMKKKRTDQGRRVKWATSKEYVVHVFELNDQQLGGRSEGQATGTENVHPPGASEE